VASAAALPAPADAPRDALPTLEFKVWGPENAAPRETFRRPARRLLGLDFTAQGGLVAWHPHPKDDKGGGEVRASWSSQRGDAGLRLHPGPPALLLSEGAVGRVGDEVREEETPLDLLDPHTGARLVTLPPMPTRRGIRWHASARDWVLLEGREGTEVWDLRSPGRWPRLRPHDGGSGGVAVSPDGKWAARSGENGVIHLWRLVR
jgi:hypothetical protein